mgnify:CR=1 FL=1
MYCPGILAAPHSKLFIMKIVATARSANNIRVKYALCETLCHWSLAIGSLSPRYSCQLKGGRGYSNAPRRHAFAPGGFFGIYRPEGAWGKCKVPGDIGAILTVRLESLSSYGMVVKKTMVNEEKVIFHRCRQKKPCYIVIILIL